MARRNKIKYFTKKSFFKNFIFFNFFQKVFNNFFFCFHKFLIKIRLFLKFDFLDYYKILIEDDLILLQECILFLPPLKVIFLNHDA